jgi:hypothetical protein
MKQFKLDVIGIGDMISFASYVVSSDENDYVVTLDKKSIAQYKQDQDAYWEFAKSFLSRVLSNKKITFTEDQNLPIFVINNEKFLLSSKNKDVCDHFKNVFLFKDSPLKFPYLVLSTKSRYYERASYEAQKYSFFSKINSLGMKVVLLGEKEVEYNAEYTIWGNNQIYSIYNDAVSLIHPSLLIDMTVPLLGLSTPSVDNLFDDMLIAYHSKACINVGVGGFFCMSIFSGKLNAVAPTQHITGISHVMGSCVFQSMEELAENVKLLCEGR